MKVGALVSPSGVLCPAPPWSTLVAVNLASGDMQWEVPLGWTEEYADRGAPRIDGILAMGGPTVTGGGLVSSAQPLTRNSAPSTPTPARCCGKSTCRVQRCRNR